jgi:hypothetical protein
MRRTFGAIAEGDRALAQARALSEIHEAPERTVRSLAFPLRAPFRFAGGFVVADVRHAQRTRQRPLVDSGGDELLTVRGVVVDALCTTVWTRL